MGEQIPPLDNDRIPSSQTSQPNELGDRIVVGNLAHTVAAVGRGASVIYHQALSVADQARLREDFEHEKLAQAVARLANGLYVQTQDMPVLSGSPYKYLLPYEFGDAWRFFGRDDFRDETLAAIGCPDSRCRLAVLHGDAGMGKTSFLRAAIAPALVAGGHLPLLLRVTDEPLPISVKRALLPNLTSLVLLQEMPLCEFLRLVLELLPEGKQVYLLVDQFEEFFDLPQHERERFANELADCLFAEPNAGRWLLSIRSAKVGYLSTFSPTIPQPLANTLVLPPLTTEQARAAILRPAELVGLSLEEGLAEVLLQDLGGDAVDPSKLQLICHTLAQGVPPGTNTLSLSAYSEAGRAEGILRNHLALVLKHNLPPEDQEPAWQALAVLAGKPAGAKQQEVVSELEAYQVAPGQALRVLEMLETNRLIRLHEQAYHLTSTSLLEPIQKWMEQRAALEQARLEAKRQLERIRESALRGVFGGGGGFMLAYLITTLDQTVDWLVLPIVTLFEGLLGATAGIAFILALDIAQACFHGRLRNFRIVWGGLAGAIIFGPALLIHALLHFPPDESPLLLAAVEGSLWGLVAGAGIAFLPLTTRPRWQTVPPLAVLSALALWVGESLGHAYRRPRIASGGGYLGLWVLLAGALLFLALAGAAMWSQRRDARSMELEEQLSSPAGSLYS